jgi:hypothetical protein
MQLPNDFYTQTTLFTLSGSSMAVWLITSVLADVFGSKMRKYKKIIALILSIGFALLGASLIADRNIITWGIAVINGFLIYSTSVGINTIMNKSVKRPPTQLTSGNAHSFLESWW